MYKYIIYAGLAFTILLVGFATMKGKKEAQNNVPKVMVWHQRDTSERGLFKQIVDQYNATHKDHQIEILYKETEELRSGYIAAAIGGQGPDLVYGPSDAVGIYALSDLIKPVDEVLPAEYFNQFRPDGYVSLKNLKGEMKKWSLADQIGNHVTLVYNKKLVPHPPQTTDELMEMGKSLTKDTNGDGKIDQYAIVWNYREPFFFIPFLTGFGGRVMDDNGHPTLDTQANVSAMQLILDMRNKYKIIPKEIDYDTAEAMFKDGKAAMVINGSWAWSGYAKAGIDYGLSPLPIVSASQMRMKPMTTSKGYSVNAAVSEEKMKYVRQVLMYLTSEEVQLQFAQKLGTLPVNIKALEEAQKTANDTFKGAYAQYLESVPVPVDPRVRQIWDGMRGPYQLIMSGSEKAEKGAKMMQLQCQKLINDTFM